MLLLSAALACARPAAPPPDPAIAEIAGSYVLQAVDGQPMPFSFKSGDFTATYYSVTLTITAQGTWSDQWKTRQTVYGTPTDLDPSHQGTVTRSGRSVTLSSDSLTYEGVVTEQHGLFLIHRPFNYEFSRAP
jgi:hypothetical protein